MEQLVSIIIPIYNTTNLKTTLEKCLNQTYSNIEILIIGKNSNNDIKLIIQNTQDKRIKYLPQKNYVNLNNYRNIGIKKAKGHYICFLDSNDLYMKNHISTSIEILQKEKADGLYSSIIIHNGISAFQVIAEYPEKEENMATYLIRKIYGAYASSLFLTRESALNTKWDEKLSHHEDYDFIIRYSKKYHLTVKKEISCICNMSPQIEEENPIDFDSCIRFSEKHKNEIRIGYYYIYINHMLQLAQKELADLHIITYYEEELEKIKQRQYN